MLIKHLQPGEKKKNEVGRKKRIQRDIQQSDNKKKKEGEFEGRCAEIKGKRQSKEMTAKRKKKG